MCAVTLPTDSDGEWESNLNPHRGEGTEEFEVPVALMTVSKLLIPTRVTSSIGVLGRESDKACHSPAEEADVILEYAFGLSRRALTAEPTNIYSPLPLLVIAAPVAATARVGPGRRPHSQ